MKESLQIHLKNLQPLLLVAIPVLLIDQISKIAVQSSLALRQSRQLIPGILNISHVTNDGAAFGILRGRNWMFVLITLVAIGFIFVYYKNFKDSSWMKVSLGFLLGGALGNFIDRIRIQQVIDFIEFRIDAIGFRWPTFNVADIAVCIGAVMLLTHMFRSRKNYEELSNT